MLALYFGVPCTGRVLHTLNIRLFADQLVYTVKHAEDEVVFVDRSCCRCSRQYLPKLSTVRHMVVFDYGAPHELPDTTRLQLVVGRGRRRARTSPAGSGTRTRPRRSATPPAPPATQGRASRLLICLQINPQTIAGKVAARKAALTGGLRCIIFLG